MSTTPHPPKKTKKLWLHLKITFSRYPRADLQVFVWPGACRDVVFRAAHVRPLMTANYRQRDIGSQCCTRRSHAPTPPAAAPPPTTTPVLPRTGHGGNWQTSNWRPFSFPLTSADLASLLHSSLLLSLPLPLAARAVCVSSCNVVARWCNQQIASVKRRTSEGRELEPSSGHGVTSAALTAK